MTPINRHSERAPRPARSRMRRRAACAGAAVLASLAAVTAASATPKPPGPAGPPVFIGKPAIAKPITGVPLPPQNPFMGPNQDSTGHNDSWQSDAYLRAGPLGRHPVLRSNDFVGDCVSDAFDKRGRLITVCVNPAAPGPVLRLIDPKSLAILSETALPPRAAPVPGIPTLKDTAGGAYFYVDQLGRVVIGTANRHIQVYAEHGNNFTLVRDYDLTGSLSEFERVVAVTPDWHGNLWFVTRVDGKVGTVNPKTGAVKTIQLGHHFENEIENGFAVGKDGAYVATNRRMLRLVAGPGGRPKIVWQASYKTIKGLVKPGQFDDGTGTTPTIMPGGYVSITDNNDPMDVDVFRTATKLAKGQRRQVCEVPVFKKGASATENSLVSVGRSLYVENNYGYDLVTFLSNPAAVSAPGIARVDLNRNGNGCRLVWTNDTVAAPSVVAKASLGSGLLYTFTNAPSTAPNDPWYWTALDLRTGRTVYKVLAGNGSQWNNHYAAIHIGPTGTAYVSGYPGGMWSLSDGPK
jgi:hypothetical protein